MQFSTVATVAAIAAVANAQYNSTVTATTVENQTTLVTITDCEEHICKETVSPALVSTATVTENNTITKYTTWCPLSGETKTTKAKSSTKAVETTTAVVSSKPAEKKPETTTTAVVSSKPAEKKPETTTTAVVSSKPAEKKSETTTVASSTKQQQSTVKVSSYTGAAAQVLPAAGALIAGAAALLL
ncbi:covalently-linked cell wall protein 12 [Monosporozyma unispora]|nr:hypothetical protein C6P44_002372 [Kazachstania unispora]